MLHCAIRVLFVREVCGYKGRSTAADATVQAYAEAGGSSVVEASSAVRASATRVRLQWTNHMNWRHTLEYSALDELFRLRTLLQRLIELILDV